MNIPPQALGTLFHATSTHVANLILADGFRDGQGNFGLVDEQDVPAALSGVFLSDRPLDANEGVWPPPDVVLAVEFDTPLSSLGEWELLEPGKGYREWCIPAAFINHHARVRLATSAELPGDG